MFAGRSSKLRWYNVEIGRFRVLGELGRGAMGVVYRAQDPKIGRTLAIKSIRLSELTDVEERGRMRERLFREAQSAGILSHPNIVTIYDVSEEEGLAYIFMEFVNGMALDDLLRATPPPTGPLVMDLLTQTAAALDYAHQNGIIHRDIKPANIMVHEGRTAKVCDFGVAKIVSQQMTQAGMLMGTPSYMSPEQIEGRPMDGRSDQFALAVMVFDILTKEKPFVGDSLPILLYKICRADPPSASEINTTLGIWVDPVLRKALAKNPDDRYPSCAAFIAELRRALDERATWMLPGKGFPGEDNTTGSGQLRSTVQPGTALPAMASSSGSGGIVSPSPTPGDSQLTMDGLTRSTANPPLIAPDIASNPPAAVLHPSVPALGSVDTVRLGRSRVEPTKTNPLLFAVPIILLIAGGGYFVYEKFSGPKPVIESPVDDPVNKDSAKVDAPKPVIKVEQQKPVVKDPVVPEPKVKDLGNVPIVKDSGKDEKPNIAGQFPIHFSGMPPGAVITVDADAATACKSPCTVALAKGRHTMTGTLEGFSTFSRSFEVGGAASVTVDLIEAIGILIVNSNPPGATVSINGQERPDKTPARFRLKAGSYQLIVRHDGQHDTPTAIVKDGVTLTLNVNFQ